MCRKICMEKSCSREKVVDLKLIGQDEKPLMSKLWNSTSLRSSSPSANKACLRTNPNVPKTKTHPSCKSSSQPLKNRMPLYRTVNPCKSENGSPDKPLETLASNHPLEDSPHRRTQIRKKRKSPKRLSKRMIESSSWWMSQCQNNTRSKKIFKWLMCRLLTLIRAEESSTFKRKVQEIMSQLFKKISVNRKLQSKKHQNHW